MKSVKEILAQEFPLSPAVGILALQGAVRPHAEKLAELGARTLEVRTPYDLEKVKAIILPGGESSTMIHLLKVNRLWEPLREFVRHHPSWGVCAGTILLSREVRAPMQESLGALDIAVERNGYGRQRESFISTEMTAEGDWAEIGDKFEGVFIRAPRITAVYGSTRVLIRHQGEPVLVEEGNVLASTFHPELTASARLHRYFLQKCARG